MRLRLGASGAEKLCALAPLGVGARPLNFTVRRRMGSVSNPSCGNHRRNLLAGWDERPAGLSRVSDRLRPLRIV